MFIQDLWDSVFTAGTTPALVKATHASFAALVVVLLFMLYATGSLHFVVMLVLTSVLWYGITWFTKELDACKYTEANTVGKDAVQEFITYEEVASASGTKAGAAHKNARAR